MARFRGIYPHTIDSKGRLSVPNRFRDALRAEETDQLVVTLGNNGCLAVYPKDAWLKAEEDVDNLPAGQAKDHFIRHFISPAQDVQLDKTGRILVPVQLRAEVGLDKDVLVVGTLNKFEIWDRDGYAKYLETSRDQARQLLETQNVRM